MRIQTTRGDINQTQSNHKINAKWV